MKKVCFVLLVALAAFYACSKQKSVEKTILGDFTAWMNSPEQLNGKVKEVKEVTYWAVEKNGTVEKGNILTKKEHDSLGWSFDFSLLFDESGMLLRNENLDENGVAMQGWTFTVDSGKYARAEFVENDTIRNVAKFKTNTKGEIEEVIMFKPQNDTTIGWYASSYDENGNRIRWQWVKANGEKAGYQAFSWDPGNRVTEVKFFSAKDSLTGSWALTYDEKGFLASQKTLDGKQVVTSDLSMKNSDFDEKGNYLKTVVYKEGKPYLLTVRNYTYF